MAQAAQNLSSNQFSKHIMTQRPIATISIPEGRENVRFEVMRELERGGDWHNRYVRHAETKVSARTIYTNI